VRWCADGGERFFFLVFPRVVFEVFHIGGDGYVHVHCYGGGWVGVLGVVVACRCSRIVVVVTVVVRVVGGDTK